jgi:hypothetical protein
MRCRWMRLIWRMRLWWWVLSELGDYAIHPPRECNSGLIAEVPLGLKPQSEGLPPVARNSIPGRFVPKW